MDLADFHALPPVGTSLSADAELDVALADDRDAAAEAAQLAELVGQPGPLRVVELFAGGGYHGRELAAAGHEAHFIDSSATMRRYMIETYGVPAERYHLATAARLAGRRPAAVRPGSVAPVQRRLPGTRPARRPGHPTGQCAAPRRSVGGGAAGSAVGLGRAPRLAIRVREATAGERHAKLVFPDAEVLVEPGVGDRPPVLWQSLTLTVTGPGGTDRTRYAHWEYLYDRARLVAVPAISRHFEAFDANMSAVFPQSSLVALRRR